MSGLLVLLVIIVFIVFLIAGLGDTSPSGRITPASCVASVVERPAQSQRTTRVLTPEIVGEDDPVVPKAAARGNADGESRDEKDRRVVPANPVVLQRTPKSLTREEFFSDIDDLLQRGIKPVDTAPIGFWEGLLTSDEQVWARRRAHNMNIVRQADALIVQRRDVYQHTQEMLAAAASVQRVETDMQADAMQSQLRLVKLQNELAEEQALAATRIETKRLEEEAKQVQARAIINPPPKPEPLAPEDPLARHRRERRRRVRAEEDRVRDFIEDIEDCCRSIPVNAAAVIIRKLLDIYELEEEVLPEWARKILMNAEEGTYGD